MTASSTVFQPVREVVDEGLATEGLATEGLATEVRTPEEAVDPAELRRWIADRLARGGSAPLLRLSVPAPRVAPETLLEVAPAPQAFFWHPPDGRAVAGTGAAAFIQLTGAPRFERLRDEAAQLWEQLADFAHPACDALQPPRLYGGLAFDVGAADAEPWEEFGDGGFTLPRLAYSRNGKRAALSLTARREELADAAGREAVAAELAGTLTALASWQLTALAAPTLLEIRRPSRERFAAEIEAIRAAIATGDYAKIVAAGCSRARLAAPLETSAVLQLLGRRVAGNPVVRFAFCRRRSTFVGVTPERLISRRGRLIETEALAGSIASGAEAAHLLASSKDRLEHQLVVDEIVRRLRPLCARLDVGAEPKIRELRDVLHLHTPITGVLAAPRHLLELVEELHPTPAVGGVPTEAAMRWIHDNERQPRGWYAAPIGWFDADGDGDFAVALRSCVLRGAEAFIYAGAGIMRDSDPQLEYTETELKKQALLTALGA